MSARGASVIAVRCILRVVAGFLLGLVPTLLLLAYAALTGAIESIGFRYVIAEVGFVGAAIGIVGGLIWAGVFLRAHVR
ncbi:MAG: hypothetical protein WB439_01890 [Acidobacteriaceae bacterium]